MKDIIIYALSFALFAWGMSILVCVMIYIAALIEFHSRK